MDKEIFYQLVRYVKTENVYEVDRNPFEISGSRRCGCYL
jgi:hypothetical protein